MLVKEVLAGVVKEGPSRCGQWGVLARVPYPVQYPYHTPYPVTPITQHPSTLTRSPTTPLPAHCMPDTRTLATRTYSFDEITDKAGLGNRTFVHNRQVGLGVADQWFSGLFLSDGRVGSSVGTTTVFLSLVPVPQRCFCL